MKFIFGMIEVYSRLIDVFMYVLLLYIFLFVVPVKEKSTPAKCASDLCFLLSCEWLIESLVGVSFLCLSFWAKVSYV